MFLKFAQHTCALNLENVSCKAKNPSFGQSSLLGQESLCAAFAQEFNLGHL